MKATLERTARGLAGAGCLCLIALTGCETESSQGPTGLGPSINADQGRRIESALKSAKRASKAKDAEDAERYYTEAVSTYAEFGAAWNNLGVSLMEQQRYLEAAEAFGRAAELSPADPRPPYNRGLLLHNRGYLRRALPFFHEALVRDPSYLNALRSIIVTDVRLGETDEQTLDLIARALMLETNSDWRDFFARHRLRIEAELGSAEGEGR